MLTKLTFYRGIKNSLENNEVCGRREEDKKSFYHVEDTKFTQDLTLSRDGSPYKFKIKMRNLKILLKKGVILNSEKSNSPPFTRIVRFNIISRRLCCLVQYRPLLSFYCQRSSPPRPSPRREYPEGIAVSFTIKLYTLSSESKIAIEAKEGRPW